MEGKKQQLDIRSSRGLLGAFPHGALEAGGDPKRLFAARPSPGHSLPWWGPCPVDPTAESYLPGKQRLAQPFLT